MSASAFDLHEAGRTPIPSVPSVDGWKELPIVENGEPLVTFRELGIPWLPFYSGRHQSSPYQPDALEGSFHELYVREGLGELALQAQSQLPENMTLVGLDGLRLVLLQTSLFEHYYNELANMHPDWSAEQLETETQHYVSKPSDDPTKPAPHRTGGSIDWWQLQLPEGYSRHDINNDAALSSGFWLPAGAAFDHGGEAASLDYWEHHDAPGAIQFRANRRKMYWLMCSVGIESYAPEFWHNNYGNQMAAKTGGLPHALYGAVDLSPDQRLSEERFRSRLGGSSHKLPSNLPLGEIISPAG